MNWNEQERLLSQVREWFDDRDQVNYYVHTAPAGATSAEQDLLASLPPPPAGVIDIGCGAGRLTLPLAEQGYRLTGVDISPPMVAAARRAASTRRSTAQFLAVDPSRLPFAAHSFDAALAIKMYCYIPSHQRRVDYLAEISRVLRPEGVLLLTSHVVPSNTEAVEALATDDLHQHAIGQFSSLEPLDTFIDGRGYVHWFTAIDLVAELSQSTFEVEVLRNDPENRQVMVKMRKTND